MSCPSPGTKKQYGLEQNAAAARIVLDEVELAERDAVPAAVGDRY